MCHKGRAWLWRLLRVRRRRCCTELLLLLGWSCCRLLLLLLLVSRNCRLSIVLLLACSWLQLLFHLICSRLLLLARLRVLLPLLLRLLSRLLLLLPILLLLLQARICLRQIRLLVAMLWRGASQEVADIHGAAMMLRLRRTHSRRCRHGRRRRVRPSWQGRRHCRTWDGHWQRLRQRGGQTHRRGRRRPGVVQRQRSRGVEGGHVLQRLRVVQAGLQRQAGPQWRAQLQGRNGKERG